LAIYYQKNKNKLSYRVFKDDNNEDFRRQVVQDYLTTQQIKDHHKQTNLNPNGVSLDIQLQNAIRDSRITRGTPISHLVDQFTFGNQNIFSHINIEKAQLQKMSLVTLARKKELSDSQVNLMKRFSENYNAKDMEKKVESQKKVKHLLDLAVFVNMEEMKRNKKFQDPNPLPLNHVTRNTFVSPRFREVDGIKQQIIREVSNSRRVNSKHRAVIQENKKRLEMLQGQTKWEEYKLAKRAVIMKVVFLIKAQTRAKLLLIIIALAQVMARLKASTKWVLAQRCEEQEQQEEMEVRNLEITQGPFE
jgi:hypothetical protein